MECVMLCEACKLPIFYDDELDEFTCPHCGEEYEVWTDEDIEMIMAAMEHMLSFWEWHKILGDTNGSETEK